MTKEEASTEAALKLRKARDQVVHIARKELEKNISLANVERLDATLTASLEARQFLKEPRCY